MTDRLIGSVDKALLALQRLGEFGATVRVDTLRGVGYMISHAAAE